MRLRSAMMIAAAALAWTTSTVAQTIPPAATRADERLRLSGATRVRYEAVDGQARPGFNRRDDLLSLRTSLLAEYDADTVKFVAELRDSRVYAADRDTPLSTGEVNALEFVQASAEARFGGVAGTDSAATIRAGRFLVDLGSRRLVAANEYRNTTNSFTGVRGDLATADWRGTLITLLPQVRRPDDAGSLLDNAVAVDRESFALVLWGGVVSRTRALGPATVELSFYHLGERDRPGRPTRDRSLDTAGLRVIRDPSPGGFDYEVEGVAQRGRAAAGTSATTRRQDVRAWFVHAEAGYSLAGNWKPRLSVEYDHASGDRRGETYGRFDTLFGTRRGDLAPSGLYSAVGRANLISPGLRLEVAPNARTDAFVGYRALWLASRFDAFSVTGVRDPDGRSGRFAGHQLDARVRHQLTKTLRLEADAVLLAKGGFLRDAPNAPPGRWTKYVSLNATTTF